jgi:hypothetical protein
VTRAAASGFVLLLVLFVSACGGTSKQEPKAPAVQPAPSSREIACLKEGGLINAERRGKNLWRADNEDPFFAVFIDRYRTAAAARRWVKEQQGYKNYADQAGRFAVTGPGEADVEDGGAVAAVAACLRSAG